MERDEYEMRVHWVPMADTGIGREAGYEDDAALIAAHKQARSKLSPETQAMLEETDRYILRRFLLGGP